MQEWIIAMLVCSALLVIRDMAKTVFSEMKKSAATLVYDQHPQKEKMQRYAEAFQKLANSFYNMPFRKDYLSNGEMEDLVSEISDGICKRCHLKAACWKNNQIQTYYRMYHLLRTIEAGDEEELRKAKAELTGVCVNQGKLMQELLAMMEQEKQKLLWNNKLLENRMAVAEQLGEMAHIMKGMSRDMFDITEVNEQFRDELQKKLKKKQIAAEHIWNLEQPDGKKQYFMEVHTRGGACVPAAEAAGILSDICGSRMVAKTDGRTLITKENSVVRFIEETNFKLLYGAVKIAKDKEMVSGDNYACITGENGQFFLCLSDGMGSGVEACRESEGVVDMLEQFLCTGISGETAARMVNSVLNLQSRQGKFSTVDIAMVDLYSGICHFLKAGAATTFVKRDHWVEAITSTSPALGLVQKADFESSTKKLYEGDMLIMVTDGVLDALPADRAEEIMKEIILGMHAKSAKELSRGILERVMQHCEYHAADDMTVLAAGLWKK